MASGSRFRRSKGSTGTSQAAPKQVDWELVQGEDVAREGR